MWSFIKCLVPAWLITFLLASTLHTFQVLTALEQVGIEIPSKAWLDTILKDAMGLIPTYGVIIAAALILAFSAVNLMTTRLGEKRPSKTLNIFLYACAGACAMAVTLSAMQPILDVTLIAGARGSRGFILQCSAGLMGGFVFGVANIFTASSRSSLI